MVLKKLRSYGKMRVHTDGSSSSVFGWNFLTIIFLIAGSVAFFLAVQEMRTAVPSFDARGLNDPKFNEVSQDIAVETWVPFEVYAPVFTARDIFKTDEEKVLEASQHASVNDAVGAGRWGEGYLLVGVIVDNDPRAVVQELNPPGVRTLKVGDKLGDATLIDVQEGLAQFERQGQRVELRFEEKQTK